MSLTEHLGQQKYLGPSGRLQQRRDAQRRITKEKTRQKATQARKRPIRRRSKKMTRLMEYYRERKALFLAKHPVCSVYPMEVMCAAFPIGGTWGGRPRQATEVHHQKGRAGTLLLDERFWIAVSAVAHRWIHDNIEESRNLGLICDKGDWDKAPDDAETRRLKQLIKEICK